MAKTAGFVTGDCPSGLRPAAFLGAPVCTNARPPRCTARSLRIPITSAMFDFIKKAKDFVTDKATEDIEKLKKFNDGLAKSREKFAADLEDLLSGSNGNVKEALTDLEDVLIMSDLGVDTVDSVMADLRKDVKDERLVSPQDIKSCLKRSLIRLLQKSGGDTEISFADNSPTVIMVIGANGMGKTTTIGKLAMRYRLEGKKVLLAACDTFRAAAVEQLETWAQRAEVDIEKPAVGQKSPSGVVYSALERGIRDKYDVVILDTSGRLHNNTNLMGELKKMNGVVKKFKEAGPEETLLVVDASIGRNAVAQARTWDKEIGLSGLVVTKLDGTARAGFVVSVVDELKIPIKLIGIGETLDALKDFEEEYFVEGLVGS